MASPFDGRRGAPPAGKWHVGETRTIGGGKIERPLTITRTARPFVMDWCDAANEADQASLSAKGLVWVPHANGHPTLRETRHVSDRERQALPASRALPHWQDREVEPA